MHAGMHTHARRHAHTCTHACTHMHARMHTHARTHAHTCTHACMHVHICLSSCCHLCIWQLSTCIPTMKIRMKKGRFFKTVFHTSVIWVFIQVLSEFKSPWFLPHTSSHSAGWVQTDTSSFWRVVLTLRSLSILGGYDWSAGTTAPTSTVWTTPESGCYDAISYCDEYGSSVCTDPMYKAWVLDNCQKYCGICGEYISICFPLLFTFLLLLYLMFSMKYHTIKICFSFLTTPSLDF